MVAKLVLMSLIVAMAAAPVSAWSPNYFADGAECFAQVGADATCAVLYVLPTNTFTAGLSVFHHDSVPDLKRGAVAPGVEPPYSVGYLHMEPYRQRHHYLSRDQYTANNPGPVEAVHLVPGQSSYFFLYLSADQAETRALDHDDRPEPLQSSGGAMPCVTVEVALYEGRDEDWSTRNSGEVVMHGRTTRTILTAEPLESLQLPMNDPCEGADGLLTLSRAEEFLVELKPVQGAPTELREFYLVATWFQADGSESPAAVAAVQQWNLRSGMEFRPRVVLPVIDPLRIVDATFELSGDEATARMWLISPWGNFEFISEPLESVGWLLQGEVQSDLLRARLFDSTGEEVVLSTLRPPFVHYLTKEGRVFEPHLEPPLLVEFRWNPAAEPGMRPGTHTLVLEAENLQGTFVARVEMQVDFLAATASSGGFSPVALAVLLTALVVAFRRQR